MKLLSNLVNHAIVNSNFQLDIGSYTLNISWNFETSNQNRYFRKDIQSDFLNSSQTTFSG